MIPPLSTSLTQLACIWMHVNLLYTNSSNGHLLRTSRNNRNLDALTSLQKEVQHAGNHTGCQIVNDVSFDNECSRIPMGDRIKENGLATTESLLWETVKTGPVIRYNMSDGFGVVSVNMLCDFPWPISMSDNVPSL